ncbi:MAG TPA: hypothetical protein VHC69_19515 [Polyangiaceae bacterium]|nr:hypothetical protein [Polyangiaceae bacterium]
MGDLIWTPFTTSRATARKRGDGNGAARNTGRRDERRWFRRSIGVGPRSALRGRAAEGRLEALFEDEQPRGASRRVEPPLAAVMAPPSAAATGSVGKKEGPFWREWFGG